MEDVVYRIDDSRVVSEMLDGEVIIIDFKDGSYYSLNNTGSVLWEKIKEGYTKSQLLSYFGERFEAAKETIEKSVHDLLTQLKERSLLKEEPVSEVTPIAAYADAKQAFFALTLQQFQDMQEMLLADPIHDVDETGWPTLKQ